MTGAEILGWLEVRLAQLTIQGQSWHMSYYDDDAKAHFIEGPTIRDCVEKAARENK